MQEKDYTLQCHGCGAIHTKRAMFLSTPLMLQGDDGLTRGAMGCPTCIATPNRIRDAYNAVTSHDRSAWQSFKQEHWATL